MRGTRIFGLLGAGLLAVIAAAPAQAGCTRTIHNRSALTAVVSRDGGPWVAIPPHRSQSIRLLHPGRIDVALTCGPGGPESAVYRASYGYTAIIDRCYIEFGDGFVEDYFGGGTFGRAYTRPLTLNNPRQGDIIVGPRVEEICPLAFRESLRARY